MGESPEISRTARFRASLSTKLIGAAVFVFLVFGLLAGVVFYSFQHIEGILRETVRHDLAENTGNAATLKQLSVVFADANLVAGTFYRNEAFLEEKGIELIARTQDTEKNSSSSALKTPLKEFRKQLQSVLQECTRINVLLRRAESVEKELEANLTSLEQTVTDKKVAQIIAGEDPTFNEQLGVLLSGYRESILQINIAVLRSTTAGNDRPSTVLSGIDDLSLRFQTLTASEPQIAAYGPRLTTILKKYRALVVEYFDAAGTLKNKLSDLERAKHQVLAVMSEIDARIAQSTTGVTNHITGVISTTNYAILALSAGIMLVLGLMTLFFLVSNIRKPMAAIREGIDQFSAGKLDARINLHRTDEWGTIEQALNRASEALQRSQETLETKIGELELEIEARKRAEATSSLLEDQLRHAQKMEAVGTLAGGVAHDFNNMLTAIIGYGNMATLRLGPDDPVQEYIRQILTAADRGATLTQSLLAFSRRQIMTPQPIELNAVILAFEPLLRRVSGDDITLQLHLSSEPALMIADRSQIEQALMNLVINSRDAMDERGTIMIETGNRLLTVHEAEELGLEAEGAYVSFSISDNGAGMDEETARRIFEPFFTTKEVGKGTGLGLAMVYGIIQQHRGSITVTTSPGNGCRFDILIPASTTEALPVEHAEASATVPQRGSETILLAEDQEEVRNFIKDLLGQYGYTVIIARNGIEAVDLYRSNAGRISLLILDVMMPEMNGRDALDAIRAESPQVKALFLSGYTGDILTSKGILDDNVCLLTKPVSPWLLVHRVREILDTSECTGSDNT